MKPIISVNELGKRYLIAHQMTRGRYTTLREVARSRAAQFFRSASEFVRGQRRSPDMQTKEFWALNDVSFDVNVGEVVGIIGRNGAGKSTLLKVLSRVTEPSRGRVELRGRIASLLEVGTGFHPELTGRENIFLNGSILGMTRAEIQRKFDEIVAFSEVEQFLDTPVKRYSSGMYVRLAFAVAAHLEPEILVVDEVLAVGDAQFQNKCIAKMKSISSTGRTVLFVSHNTPAIRSLCSRAILLNRGSVACDGDVDSVLQQYLGTNSNGEKLTAHRELVPGLLLSDLTVSPTLVESCGSVDFELSLTATKSHHISDLCLLFYSDNGIRAAIADLRPASGDYRIEEGQDLSLTGTVQSFPGTEGVYSVGLFLKTDECRQDFYDLTQFTVLGIKATGNWLPYAPQFRGTFELQTSIFNVTKSKNEPQTCS